MRRPSISRLVFKATYPRRYPEDPNSFSEHVTRHLLPEIRAECLTFYGSLDEIEAQYPGFDYTFEPHRRRLSRFPWHRKLFRAFDRLRLTFSEISYLCDWDGTKSAREQYEREQGVTIRDTTADDIPVAPRARLPSVEVDCPDSAEEEEEETREVRPCDAFFRHTEDGMCLCSQEAETEEDMSNEEIESYGLELNNRLIAASAAREQGADVPLDDAWEQWLSEEADRRGYTLLSVSPPPSRLRYASSNFLVSSASMTANVSRPASPAAVQNPPNYRPGAV